MRICMISEAKSIHTRRWAGSLAESGCEIHLISSSPCEIPGVVCHYMPIYDGHPLRQWRNLRAIRREIRKIGPNVVHLFGMFALSSLGSMILLRGLHPVISVWGSDIIPAGNTETWKARFIKRYLLRKAVRIVASSRYLMHETAAFSPKRIGIEVVPFGVDLKMFSPSQTVCERNEVRIGFAKNLTSLSGPDILLRAFSLVREKTEKPMSLWIAGTGSMEAGLRKLATDLGIEESIHWVGWIEGEKNLSDFFRSIDIFVQPSRRESFGVSAVQASACGIPVVSSKYGGIPEVVLDRKTGFLVPPENDVALAEAILSLVHGPGLRLAMGSEGRKWIEENFEWKTCVSKMIGIYRKLCTKKCGTQTDGKTACIS